MNKRIILWIYLSSWFLLLGGIIFDTIVIAANWKAGTLQEVQSMGKFFHVANPGQYFIVKYFVCALAIICAIQWWRTSATMRNLLIAALVLFVFDAVLSALVFDPIIGYVSQPDIDPGLLTQKASLFYNLNFLRIGIDGGGVLVTMRAVHVQYT